MMRLKRFRVMNFRSVSDSGWISCDDVTSLIGINESGKTNIIIALWKLNPARGGDIDLLHDLPAKEYSNWRDKGDEIEFITAEFELDDELVDEVSKLSGCSPESARLVSISRKYSGIYVVSFPEYSPCGESDTDNGDGDGDVNPATLSDVSKLVVDEMPSFVYYSNYGNLDAQIYLPHTVAWINGKNVPGLQPDENKVRTLRVLFEYVGLEPQEILELGKSLPESKSVSGKTIPITKEDIKIAEDKKEERTRLLNSAGTKLTKDFKEWWKQGNYIFRFQADGDFFKIWVSDEIRPEEIELERRSTGLQWFLSFFLVFQVESKEAHKDSILLLDEAGLSLHPLAQKDLLGFFEGLAESNQIIYTTHSPFLVDTSNIDRARVVYSDKTGSTVVSENLRASAEGSKEKLDERSVYALHAALGLSVSDVLIQGCQPVVVEGPSDQNYLNAIKLFLIRDGKIAPSREIVFMPSGGVKGIPGIVSIVCGKDDSLPYVVLDSDHSGLQAKNKLVANLYEASKDKVILTSDVCKMEFSEIEDLVPPNYFERPLNKMFTSTENFFMDSFDNSKPIVNQIQKFATENGIELKKGWKVEISKQIKEQLIKASSIDSKYVDMWKKLFERILTKD